MKRILFLALLSLTACEKNEKDNLNVMKKELELTLNDFAFKDNATIEFYTFEAISYDTVNENTLDTLKSLKVSEMANLYLSKSVNSMKMGNSNLKLQSLSNGVSKSLYDMYKKDAEEYFELARVEMDSAKVYMKQDTLIRERINARKNPEMVYRAKFFIKATQTDKKGGKQNIMDTTMVYYNKNMKIIKL